jgi:hypothetical protein
LEELYLDLNCGSEEQQAEYSFSKLDIKLPSTLRVFAFNPARSGFTLNVGAWPTGELTLYCNSSEVKFDVPVPPNVAQKEYMFDFDWSL